MDELARLAGVGKGTLYRRFADRSALCRALLHDDALELQARALAGFGLPPTASWLARLEHLLDALFDFAVRHAALLSEAAAFARGSSARFEHPAHDWQRQEIALCLRKAVVAREIAALDPLVTADLLLAALDPDLLTWHLGLGTPEATLRASFQRLWKRGIVPAGS